MTAIHPVDWICLGILLASLLLGAWRGLLYEALSLTGWIVAYIAARVGGALVGDFMPMGDAPEGWRYAAGFTLVFICVAFLGGALAWMGRGAGQLAGLRPVDRLLGAVFGAVRGVALLLLLAIAVQLTPLGQTPWWRDSVSGPWLQSGLQELRPWLPPPVRQYLPA